MFHMASINTYNAIFGPLIVCKPYFTEFYSVKEKYDATMLSLDQLNEESVLMKPLLLPLSL